MFGRYSEISCLLFYSTVLLLGYMQHHAHFLDLGMDLKFLRLLVTVREDAFACFLPLIISFLTDSFVIPSAGVPHPLQQIGMDDSKHGGQTYPEMVKGATTA